MKDLVYHICEQMLSHSPARSFKRLNPALQSTLGNCIEADLPFLPETFRRIHDELRGGRWFGDGEHFYSQAVACNHASAYQSFEGFAERPGVLWEENSGPPSRVHVGSQFTWKGHYVTVTSMQSDKLVACTYKDSRCSVSGIKVGAEIGGGWKEPTYVVTKSQKAGAEYALRVVKVNARRGDSNVARRFTIPYADIAEFRRSENERVKKVLARIASCDPQKDATKLTQEISAQHFRHFQLEAIRSAFQKRKDWQANEGRVLEWRNGANGAWLDVKATLLRVAAGQVDCSNGNSVSKAAACRVLPVLLAQRQNSAALNLPLEGYRVERVNRDGVKIGCTLLPWEEIERIAPQLK